MRNIVTICVEQSNRFNQIFMPLANKLALVLKQAGYDIHLSTNVEEFRGTKIIFGAHSNPHFWAQNAEKRDIFVNFEPVYLRQWAAKNTIYCQLLKTHRVLDYTSRNASHFEKATVLPVPPQFDFSSEYAKEIDVLFIGNPTEYRKKKLEELIRHKIKVNFGFAIFGEQLFKTICQSRIFLSINDSGQDLINLFRFSLCSNSSTLFVGETKNITENPEFAELIGISVFTETRQLAVGLSNSYLTKNSF